MHTHACTDQGPTGFWAEMRSVQLPNDSSDSADPRRNSAELSEVHVHALNLEAVFNLAVSNALGGEEGLGWVGGEERCAGRGGKVREKYS